MIKKHSRLYRLRKKGDSHLLYRKHHLANRLQSAPLGFQREEGACGMRLTSVLTILSLLMVTACSSGSSSQSASLNKQTDMAAASDTSAAGRQNVGILLPLSGRNGVLGRNMLKAAELALSDQGAPAYRAHDTATDPQAAARKAVEEGAGILIGPLTAQNTALVTPLAQTENIPVLAFTSDIRQARPGVWVMGITPEQQIHYLVKRAVAEGRKNFAAFLPDNPLGHAMGDGLISACEQNAVTAPTIIYHSNTRESIETGLKTLSNYTERKASSLVESAPQNTDNLLAELDPAHHSPGSDNSLAEGNKDQPGKNEKSAPLAPPPFDALVLADTGTQLQNIIETLKTVQVSSSHVRILGPGLWAAFASKLGGLSGAWYTAPDPSLRQSFVSKYMARYHSMPKPLADLAYDAAALAKNLSKNGGYTNMTILTQPEGFSGVDGVFNLTSQGHVSRELAIFEIQSSGGGKMLAPTVNTKVGNTKGS